MDFAKASDCWGSWINLGGFARGQKKYFNVLLHNTVTDVRLHTGADGARLTVTIDQNNGTLYVVSPSSKWVKNGTSYLPVEQIHAAVQCSGVSDCDSLISACFAVPTCGNDNCFECDSHNNAGQCEGGTCHAIEDADDESCPVGSVCG